MVEFGYKKLSVEQTMIISDGASCAGADLHQKVKVNILVNGKRYHHEIEPNLLLVYYLRDVIGLKGTHIGCDTSNCGACTVIVNGKALKSCTYFAVQADGKRVHTIEGLAKNGRLHPIQRIFSELHALQCGYCTPGMIMAAASYLLSNPEPTEEQARMCISGNLCMCTGYQNIVKAIMAAAKEIREKSISILDQDST